MIRYLNSSELVGRAASAYRRAGGIEQPANYSDVQEVRGKRYVHLVNVNGTLAVYGVGPSGRITRLKRWPKAVEGRNLGRAYEADVSRRQLQETARSSWQVMIEAMRDEASRVQRLEAERAQERAQEAQRHARSVRAMIEAHR